MSDLRDQLALYVLDELDPSERAEVEEALRQDEELRAEEAAWRRDLGALLAESAPDVELSAAELDGLTARLMGALPKAPSGHSADAAGDSPTTEMRSAEIRQPRPDELAGERSQENARADSGADVFRLPASPQPEIQPPVARSSAWAPRLALAASLLSMILAATAFFWMRSSDATERIAELERRNAELAQELSGLRQGLERADQAIARVSSDLLTMGYPQSSPVVLAGLEAAPEAAGSAFYKPSAQQALFHAYGLPRAEPGTIYQLWYIPDGGNPVSAGVFDVDLNGEATVQVEGVPAAERIALWAVTVEPEGGSPQPTGTMVIRS